MVGKYIPNFYDFPNASGGITCDFDFYMLADGNISIRKGTDDAANQNVRPRIDFTTPGGKLRVGRVGVSTELHGLESESPSGVANVSIGSGLYYGIFTSVTSGVPGAAGGAYGVIPWEKDFNPGDVHFRHDPSDDGENTHVQVMVDGWYEISYNITLHKSLNNTRTSIYCRCVKNNTVVLPASMSLSTFFAVSTFINTNWHGLVYLDALDQITVECREYSANANDVNAIGDGASLLIKYIGPSL